jgi:glycosyltransferase involved in cell wall biosynthesis
MHREGNSRIINQKSVKSLVRASVITTGRNVETYIQECLNSLIKLDFDDYEVIYVDGGSSDRTLEYAGKIKGVKICIDNGNSPASGRNVGIREAKGDILAFIDADCVAPSQWLQKLDGFIRTHEVGGVGGPYEMPPSSSKTAKIIRNVLDTFLGSGNVPLFKTKRSRLEPVTAIQAGNVAFPRKILQCVGLFNPNLRYLEDYDLSQRIRSIGKEIIFLPEAYVYHKSWQFINLASLSKLLFSYGRGRFEPIRTSSELFSLLRFVPLFFLFFFIALGILTPFWNLGYWLVVLMLIYLIAVLFSSFMLATRHKKVVYIVVAPLVYLIIHLSYALGSLVGLISGIMHADDKSRKASSHDG